MASFISRLFGGKKNNPISKALAPKEEVKKTTRAMKPRGTKTTFTNPLGLGVQERSQQALKTLTGQ